MSPKEKPTLPVDIYVRVSKTGGRDVNREGLTADVQERRCRAQLEAAGFEAGEVFKDLDESGWKKSRPQFDKVMARIENGQSGGVCTLNFSRLTRAGDLINRILWIETRGHQVKPESKDGAVYISVEERVDTSTASGRLLVRVLDAINLMKVEEGRESADKLHAEKIARGQWIGTVPTGYDIGDDGVLVSNEHAPVVVQTFELRGRGGSWSQVAQLLTDAGVPNSRERLQAKAEGREPVGSKWSIKSVQEMLRSDAYIGVARSGQHVNHKAHEPLVLKALFRKVSKRGSERMRGSSEGSLLSGLLRCGGCGKTLTPDWLKKSNGKRYLYYRCKASSSANCPHRATITAAQIEPYVIDWVTRNVALIDDRVDPFTDEEFEKRWRAAEDEVEECKRQIDAGEVRPTAGMYALEAAEKALEEIERERPPEVTGVLYWPSMTREESRALLRGEELEMDRQVVGFDVRIPLSPRSIPERRQAIRELLDIDKVKVRVGQGTRESDGKTVNVPVHERVRFEPG
jgi:DNA invertase Pin-like site-specific DNA recombinase